MTEDKYTPINTEKYPHLFHYRDLNHEHFYSLMRDKKIKFSNPTKLNDPWEFEAQFCDHWTDPKKRQETADWLIMNALEIGDIEKSEANHHHTKLMNNKPYMETNLAGTSNHLKHAADEEWRIVCLSKKNDNILMWGHYADSHKGICLVFSSNKEPFVCARKVEYEKDMPLLYLPQAARSREEIISTMLTKPIDWEYEHEYRYVFSLKTQNQKSTYNSGDFLYLPKGSLVGIIAGCEMSEANFEFIEMARDKFMPDLPIYQAQRDVKKYGIYIPHFP